MNLVRAEFLKALTLPSTHWLTVVVVISALTLSPLVSTGPAETSATGTVELLLRVLQIPILALGCLLAAQEVGGSQLATTLRVAPRRGRLLAAMVACTTVVGGLVSAVAAGLVARGSGGVPFGHLASASLYLVLVVCLGWAGTMITRSLVAALAGLGSALVLMPVLAGILPAAGRLPGAAGTTLLTAEPSTSDALWLLGWAALAITGAAATVTRRDV